MVKSFETKVQLTYKMSRAEVCKYKDQQNHGSHFHANALAVSWIVYTVYRYLGQKYLFMSPNDVR